MNIAGDWQVLLKAVEDALVVVLPAALPVIFGCALWKLWMRYIRTDFMAKQEKILLELKLPKEMAKSPLAMEVVLTAFYQTGAATLLETYWGGKVRPWFSLELVSMEGNVHFFVWTWKRYKNLVEAQLYAQYPNLEIYEVPDYTDVLHHDPVGLPMWSTLFQLTQPDPFPIKTYVDYGLDQDKKEEVKVDPITSVLEYLGSMRKGEYSWVQIVIQAHRKDRRKAGALFEKVDWKEEAKGEIDKIKKEASVEGPNFPILQLSKFEENKITALERSISKFPFETGIRGVYFAEKDSFNPVGITGLIGTLRQYSSNTLNGFKLGKFTDFDYPWQDFRRIRRNRLERRFIEAYKARGFFHPPHRFKTFILNTEELATIWHPVGRVGQTPTLERIMSKKAEAPANLPI